MGLYKRICTAIGSKINKLLDRVEDPRETLDYSYEKQVDLLENVKKGITELVTAKKTLEHQRSKLSEDLITLDEQAKEALKQGKEDIARLALERKAQNEEDIVSLNTQIKDLKVKQEKLEQTKGELEVKIEMFRTRKETLKAQYSAAEAQSKIAGALTGVDDSIGNVGDAVRRAEDKTETMNARGEAIGELVDSGVLDDSLGTGGNAIDKQLSKARTKSKVDEQLAKMKEEMKKE